MLNFGSFGVLSKLSILTVFIAHVALGGLVSSGHIEDQINDSALDDLVSATVTVDDQSRITFEVHFNPATFVPGLSMASLDLDLDRSTATGYPGTNTSNADAGIMGQDAFILVPSYNNNYAHGGLWRSDGSPYNYTPSYNFVTLADGYRVTIPLADLGGTLPTMNFKVVSQRALSSNSASGIHDYMSNVGSPVGAVLPLPQEIAAPLSRHFDFSNAAEARLYWETEPGEKYNLWESTNLQNWSRVNGFPKLAEGNEMAHAFTPDPGGKGFFKIELVGLIPDGFASIPAGSFYMGDQTGDIPHNDVQAHLVHLHAFSMEKHEVTKAQWDEVTTWGLANGYTDLPAGGGKGADHPVHTISWHAAVKWCNARSEREGREPCYTSGGVVHRTGYPDNVACNWSAGGYRLPTEAEWEKAARGGLAGLGFPWGNTISHGQANYSSQWTGTPGQPSSSFDVASTPGYHPSYNTGNAPFTSPVKSFEPNGYGLHDMAGNVAEFCWDRYSSTYYANSPGANPRGPASGEPRIVRGGGWDLSGSYCLAAWRTYAPVPLNIYNFVGFRVARSSIP